MSTTRRIDPSAAEPELDFGEDFFEGIQERLDGLPAVLAEKAQAEWARIREIVLEKRPPRIAIIGRRGAGKSSLINAIFQEKVADVGSVESMTGRSRWHTYRSRSGRLDILDTRGLGDRTRPDDAEHETTREDLMSAVAEEMPDVILFLCKAKEVDARIEEDIRGTLQIQRDVEDRHRYRPPIVGLVTQVDELDPKRVDEPPYADTKKRENIELACGALKDAFTEAGCEIDQIFAVSAYAEYKQGEVVYSNAWNVDRLVEYLASELPNSARLMMARAGMVRSVQRNLAQDLVRSSATVCAGIAATPIPVADAVPITTAQIAMITGIGFLSGRSASKKTAKEFLGAMGAASGAAFVFREVARGLLKLIPGAGHAISAGVAFAGTWTLGQAAIHYFIDGGTAEEARARMKNAKKDLDKGRVEMPDEVESETTDG